MVDAVQPQDGSHNISINGDAAGATAVSGTDNTVNNLSGQSNVIGDNAVVGDHNLILHGPAQVVFDYAGHPKNLYTDLQIFITRHPLLSAAYGLVQFGLGYTFWFVKDRYLLGIHLYVLLALLLTVALSSFYVRWRLRNKKDVGIQKSQQSWFWLGTVTAVLALALLAITAYRVVRPVPFSDEEFGIAIATFGKAGTLQAGRNGYELASRLQTELNSIILANVTDEAKLSLRRIGVVAPDSNRFDVVERKHNAKLLIAGHFFEDGQSIDVQLHVFQSEEPFENPDFPQPVPLDVPNATVSFTIPTGDSAILKEVIQEQSQAIAQLSLGLASYHSRDYSPAIAHLTQAQTHFSKAQELSTDGTQLNPTVGLLDFFIGRGQQTIGRYDESFESLERAIAATPDEISILQVQLYNYRVINDLDGRAEIYERLLELSQTVPESKQKAAAYNRARAHFYVENYEAAVAEYLKLIENHPDYFVAYLDAALAYREQGNFDDAHAIIEDARPLTVDVPERQFWLTMSQGRVYDKQDKLSEAAQAFEAAVALEPPQNNARLHFYLAEVYGRQGKITAAKENFEKAILISDVSAWIHAEYAEYLYSIEEYDGAVDHFEIALAEPQYDRSMTYARLGLVFKEVGDQTETIHAFENAVSNIRAEPGTHSADAAYIHHEYGVALAHFKMIPEAIQEIEKAITLQKEFDPVALNNLYKLLIHQSKTEQASEIAHELVEHCQHENVTLEILRDILNAAQQFNIDPARCPRTVLG